MKCLSMFLLCLFTLGMKAFGAPAQVIIIRHAEKPEVGNELNETGWKRARALPKFFAKFEKPVALYAGSPKKAGGSVRSIQTLTPYAQEIGLPIHTEITKNEISTLVDVVMKTEAYRNRTVIICWEHSVIPDMAKLFGATSAPDSWADDVFDRAWVLTFQGQRVHFEDLPEHVLPQDS